jgi:hypothetical protein
MENEKPISDLTRLLSSIHWTLETHVAPNVEGSLARSYVRTLLTMIRHAEKKSQYEWPVLRDDLADLCQVLGQLGVAVDDADADFADLDVASLEGRIARLEPQLSRALPGLDKAQRVVFDGFVLRRIARQRCYIPDIAPANSF